MSDNFEGDFNMRAVEASISNVKGKMKVRVEMEIVDGPRQGRRASYDGKLDADNIKWTKLDMIALGWQGKDAKTFVDDVRKANKAVGCRVRIATHTYSDTGKTKTWLAVDRIGRASGAAAEPLSDEQFADVNSWFAEVPDAQGGDDSLPF